jgi:hypothetical protein
LPVVDQVDLRMPNNQSMPKILSQMTTRTNPPAAQDARCPFKAPIDTDKARRHAAHHIGRRDRGLAERNGRRRGR